MPRETSSARMHFASGTPPSLACSVSMHTNSAEPNGPPCHAARSSSRSRLPSSSMHSSTVLMASSPAGPGLSHSPLTSSKRSPPFVPSCDGQHELEPRVPQPSTAKMSPHFPALPSRQSTRQTPILQQPVAGHVVRVIEADSPLAARLPQFREAWRQLPTLSSRHRRTVARGLFFKTNPARIVFPKVTSFRPHYVTNPVDLAWARAELARWRSAGILTPCLHDKPLLHPWFVVRKRGKRRLVIDFDRLNQAVVESPTVAYQDLRLVPRQVRRHPWLTSIDFKSAFHHVPLAKDMQRLSSILVDGETLSLTVMSFGLNIAPKIWCELLKAALAPLQATLTNMRLTFYMDDILIAARTRTDSHIFTSRLISHLNSLGLVINFDKSSLIPVRRLQHLGFIIDTRSNTFAIPTEKAQDISAFARTCSLRPSIRLSTARSLLGKLLALQLAFAPCRRFTWPLIQDISSHIPSSRQLRSQLRTQRIALSNSSRADLAWLADNLLHWPPRPFITTPTLSLFTDACLRGWGGFSPDLQLSARGRWSNASGLHIQILELAAVINTINSLPIPPGSRIRLFTDNTSVLSYVQRWGGSQNEKMLCLARLLWDTLLKRSLSIVEVLYIPSQLNILADQLSRA